MTVYQAFGRRLASMRNAAAAASAATLLLAAFAQPAFAQAPAAGKDKPANPAVAESAGGDAVTLNFKDADIDSVVGAFGHLLNRTFIIDPRVRGKMTLETPRPVSRAQAYRLLQSQLRSQGFAVVEAGGLTKVVPEADAKLQSSPVTAGRTPGASGDQIVTQIFRLTHESASNLVPVLRPLISPNNTIVAYPNNNSLVVTDYAANLQRIARIVATLDSPSTSGVEVVPIEHAVAADIAVAVSRMLDDSARASAGAQVDAGQRVLVMADPRINAVMIRTGSAAKMTLGAIADHPARPAQRAARQHPRGRTCATPRRSSSRRRCKACSRAVRAGRAPARARPALAPTARRVLSAPAAATPPARAWAGRPAPRGRAPAPPRRCSNPRHSRSRCRRPERPSPPIRPPTR